MRTSSWPVVASLLLAGCAGFSDIDSSLNTLVGRPEGDAFRALGYPDSRQQYGDATVYYWGTASSGTLLLPQTSTVTGQVGNVPVSGTVSSMQATSYHYSCKLKLVVEGGLVKSYDYDGNLGGCLPFHDRIKAANKATLR